MVDDASSDQVRHPTIAAGVEFPEPEHGHQAGLQNGPPVAFEQLGWDDDVDRAGLVFERDKDRAAGGFGALPVGDQTAGARGHTVAPLGPELLGSTNLE